MSAHRFDGFEVWTEDSPVVAIAYSKTSQRACSGEALGLSPAEGHVAHLAAAGHTNRGIAGLRGTAERTVANQLASIFRKLGVASRADLALILGEAGTSAVESR